MSNHFNAANLQHPGDDARLDLTETTTGTRWRMWRSASPSPRSKTAGRPPPRTTNPQGVRPHEDLLSRFPYLGLPNS